MNYKHINPKPVVIITGCGSGIGYELAQKFYLLQDYNVVVTARKKSLAILKNKLDESDRFILRELDITNNDNINSLVQEIVEKFGRVDAVINNAAVCYRAVIEHMDDESELLQLKTNYLGPMALIRAVLAIMREQGHGNIINISSVSGMLAMPTMGSYSASKHALEGATESLWYEAKPFGINVNLVQLGFINSDSFKRVQYSKKAAISAALSGPHSDYYASMTPMIERLMSWSLSSSNRIAEQIIDLIKKPNKRLRVALTPDAFVFSILKKVIPSRFFNQFLYLLLPGSLKWGKRWQAKHLQQQQQQLIVESKNYDKSS
jgi:NAD(P)-dependent dehydrogenase (short-subunit alcohol dehydrogenase family)